MKRIYKLIIGILLINSSFYIAANEKDKIKIPLPSKAQLAWQEAELVALFHYDLHVFDGKDYKQSENRITPIEDINIFNPIMYDTDQWIRSVKTAGAKIAIITATHETGFALYQSDVNPYCMKALKWKDGKGDIINDFINSCRKYDILPGIFIGIRWNSYLGVHDFTMPKDSSEFQKRRQLFYNKMCEKMTEELVSRYGDLAIVWYDGGASGPEAGGPDILPVIEKHQKDILFYRNHQRSDLRWSGNENGEVDYPNWGAYLNKSSLGEFPKIDSPYKLRQGDPYGKYYMPTMSDTPLRGYNGAHEWFWEPNDEKHIYPLKELIKRYYLSVGRNSTLVIGVTPDDKGLLPQADSIRLAELGTTIQKIFSHPIKRISGTGYSYQIKMDKSTVISQIVIQEDITQGEKVLKYKIEGKQKNKWILLAEGSCIGHKRIELLKNPEAVSAVRLIINDAIDTPIIKNISLY
jgi:hypothetical protein